MIQSGDDDFIASLPGFIERQAKVKRLAGHALAKADLFGTTSVQKVNHSCPRSCHNSPAAGTGRKGAVQVANAQGERLTDGIYHPLRHLGASGAIEVNGRFAIHL
jgi:hypothetical protein